MVAEVVERAVPGRLVAALSLGLVLLSAGIGLSGLLHLVHVNWTEPGGHFQHGYLVLLLALVLGVRYWRSAPPAVLAPDWRAVLPLLAVVAALALMDFLLASNMRLVLLPPFAIFAVALTFGREAAARLAWPIIFVYFALPQWWAINDVLQKLTVMAVTPMVHWSGIPAYIDGNFVQIPAGAFEVAAGCAGLRYLVASLALGAFYALAFLRSWRNRALLVAVAGFLAVLANWVRVYLLVLVGHLTDMQHYVITVEHDSAGWIVFMVLVSPVLFLGRWLERREEQEIGPEDRPASEPPQPFSSTVSIQVLPAAVLSGLVLLLPASFARESFDGEMPPVELPEQLGGAERIDRPVRGWQPIFINAASDLAAYRFRDTEIEVYLGVYPHQDIEHRLIRGHNDPRGREFRGVARETRAVPAGDDRIEIVEYRGTLGGRTRLIWSWYRVGGIPAAGVLEAKWAELRGAFRDRHDALVVAVSIDCELDCKAAEAALSAFVAQSEPALRWQPPGDDSG